MNPLIHPSKNKKHGFTLVEILVSIAVLGLMVAGVAQMMNSEITATLGGYKHMDADTEARMVLDRMAFDISRITKRTDVDYYFQKNSTAAGSPNYGNDQMAFYSESGGYYPSSVTGTTGASDVSLVGYMIAPMLNGAYNANGTPQLVRLSKGLSWNGVSSGLPAMVFNPLANVTGSSSITSNTITTTSWNGAANGIANGTDPNYQVIGDQVFRLEYCFLVQTSPTGYPSGAPTITQGGFYDSPWTTKPDTTPNGLQNVTAIVVSIAVLDTNSRAILGSNAASYLKTASSDLSDDKCTITSPSLLTYSSVPTSASASLPLALWKANLLNNRLGLPPAVASQVRFYQRFCYLNHLQ